jgi:hypothetical protein
MPEQLHASSQTSQRLGLDIDQENLLRVLASLVEHPDKIDGTVEMVRRCIEKRRLACAWEKQAIILQEYILRRLYPPN